MRRLIELNRGQPDVRLLPLDELRRAALHRLSLPDASILQYGPERGRPSMLRLLAEFLSPPYRIEVDPDRLIVTQGASHGLDLILSRYTAEGDTVFVEDPTYFHALKIFDARRVRIVPVPTDERGIDVDALKELLRFERPKLLYTIPIHHNPTGATLDRDRREKIVALAREHDFLIAADEVYQLLTYEGDPPPPMQTLDPDRVLSLGSFSKILAPGTRLGWIDAAPHHVEELSQCGVLRSGGGASPLAASIVESAIETGILAEYLDRIRDTYRRRCHAMIRALETSLPPSITFARPSGGFFVWLRLPAGTDATALEARALAEGIRIFLGSRASVTGALRDRIRLCFTYYDEAEIDSAIRRLAKVLN